ncbi:MULTISPECIES: hypothetical protein [Rhizobium]|uniref:hypothetical protein n=1 Tax=Rhizobium TaxID=379 RepID=UPI0017C8C92A|nr:MULTISPECIES: hypothetical protein [Rhizobium]
MKPASMLHCSYAPAATIGKTSSIPTPDFVGGSAAVTEWNRYNVKFDIESPKKAVTVRGGPAVMESSAAGDGGRQLSWIGAVRDSH